MRPLLNSRAVAFCGLFGMAMIAVLMLTGQLDLVAAAKRAAALLVLLLVVERVLLPVARALVGETLTPAVPAEPEDTPPEPATAA